MQEKYILYLKFTLVTRKKPAYIYIVLCTGKSHQKGKVTMKS